MYLLKTDRRLVVSCCHSFECPKQKVCFSYLLQQEMVNMTHICFLAQTVDVIPHRETTHGIPGACLARQRVNIQPGAEVLVVNPGQCPLFAE